MVKKKGRRGLRGLVGTPMGGPRSKGRTSTPPAERSDHLCPDCRAVPGQPCRTITSAAGGALQLGNVRPTMHARRPSGPVEISSIDPNRPAFVPRNQRPEAELGRTDRLGQDALPRGQRRNATSRNFY
jgi:hypothetical protein